MQNKQRPKNADWKSEAEQAKRALAELRDRPGITSSLLAVRTNLSQPQVSRLLNGKFKRASRGVRCLVEYAKTVNEFEQPKAAALASRKSRSRVIRAALQTWDQTDEGADVLVKLLRTVQNLRRAGRTR